MKALVFAALTLSGLAAAHANELTGTAYTVVWRGAGMAQANARQPTAPSGGVLLRLIDVSARRELARAPFDNRLGGWLFQMPFNVTSSGSRCLALLDIRNQAIAVRAPNSLDTGVGFRNTAWEEELARQSDLVALRNERATVQTQVQATDQEIARLLAETGLPDGASPAQCALPPPPPEPPRPLGALDAAQATAVAGPACAWRWEQDHGKRISLGRLFADAGLEEEWNGRAQAQPLAESLSDWRIPIAGADLSLVLDAAAKGRTYLEHADGVRVLIRAQGACRAEFARRSTEARQRWQQAVEAAQQAPARARAQCAEKLQNITRLRSAQAAAPALLSVLDKRIAEFSAPPGPQKAVPLVNQSCQP